MVIATCGMHKIINMVEEVEAADHTTVDDAASWAIVAGTVADRMQAEAVVDRQSVEVVGGMKDTAVGVGVGIVVVVVQRTHLRQVALRQSCLAIASQHMDLQTLAVAAVVAAKWPA